ncbi:hypothetical protein N8T08_005447 [Aspergillus melleus]|uniref:Uncharacterized protein n=1 Tax=Aspergillus melleus TaxID=138277 RepID=A0ACC3B2J1_9EURO|nr:hypothetical protein N8T08_005447 [Aspergillus melleus]
MSRALKDGVNALKAWVAASASRSAKIAKGEGSPGTRAAPTRTAVNDSNIGDGEVFKRYKLQANKNASNATIKSLANQNSHKVYAEADVAVDDSIFAEDKISKLFEDLENDVDERMRG